MDVSKIIEANFSDLMGKKTLMGFSGPMTFSVINFEPFIKKMFPDQDKFISADAFTEIRTKVCNKFGNDNSSFFSNGILEDISINDLKFYQSQVGINGPRHSSIDEPVFILKYNGSTILYNGYHRTLPKILANDSLVKGYVLTLID